MKTFERVLFLVAFLFIDIYTTRHIYQRWFAPKTSVLDEFRSETEVVVDSASQLRQLLAKYRPAREAVRKLEQQNVGKSPDEWQFQDQEPFKTEATLRQAIEEWEGKQRELFETRVYWTFGSDRGHPRLPLLPQAEPVAWAGTSRHRVRRDDLVVFAKLVQPNDR